jgi:glycosyltransferase involved in cell wall biosynthesis
MKISLLSHDISDNCLGRAHVLARLLATDHEVEIVGPSSSGEIWAPLRDDDVVPIREIPRGRLDDMAAHVTGDLLYPVKERPTSLGVALAARKRRNRPLIADSDDWEMGFTYDDVAAMWHSRFRDETKWVARSLLQVRRPNNVYRTAWTERQLRRADAVTVSSRWLAKRFGGTVVEHSRDTSTLDPSLVSRERSRAELGIRPGKTVILFMGSPRRHKGLHNIVAALDLLRRDDIVFLTVGASTGLPSRPYIKSLGFQAFASVTKFLSAADLVVLPQESGPAARGQMPAKVYDAMAMRRALIVSDVSDLAATVEGCGLVVPPGDVEALADSISTLADNPELRARMGEAGRERCVAHYSDDAIRPRLLNLVDEVMAGSRR